MPERFSIVLGAHGQVEDLRSGAVAVPGVDLDFVQVKRMPDAYREMVRTQPYAICELAPTTYLMALAAGAPMTALPIPMTRRFRHKGLLRKRTSSIRTPKDLEGRPVGVRAYSVTAAVWTRGVLADAYGVDLGRITWLTEEEENVTGYVPPANVKKIPDGQTLAGLMAEGRIEAGFAGLAGVGSEIEVQCVELIDDASAREVDWFRTTGIYPLHGVIAVRNDVLRAHPDLGLRLFGAFSQAKQNYLSRVTSGVANGAEDVRYRKLAEVVGDPLPYGLAENRKSFEALVRFAAQQGLIDKAPAIERLFPDPRARQSGELALWG
jgi:4,5-dihydroxyphthalate decarboxylase